jgi:hypothetical protein
MPTVRRTCAWCVCADRIACGICGCMSVVTVIAPISAMQRRVTRRCCWLCGGGGALRCAGLIGVRQLLVEVVAEICECRFYLFERTCVVFNLEGHRCTQAAREQNGQRRAGHRALTTATTAAVHSRHSLFSLQEQPGRVERGGNRVRSWAKSTHASGQGGDERGQSAVVGAVHSQIGPERHQCCLCSCQHSTPRLHQQHLLGRWRSERALGE